MKRSMTIIANVLACLSLFIGFAQPVAAARGNVLLGVYYGNQGWDMPNVQAMETWQDNKKHAVVNLFTNWCADAGQISNLFTQQLPAIWDNQNVPMITWEPKLGDPYLYNSCQSAITPLDIEVQAVNGTYYNYFNDWALDLKDFILGTDLISNTDDDRRVYLRLAHEMNGDWYEWSAAKGGNSPNDYIAMWRYIRGIFNSNGLDGNHVQWVWSVNNTDAGGFTAEQYYPGDNYVHWVAIDGYNFGDSLANQLPVSTWKTPEQVFDNMVSRLRRRTNNKPLAITEVGSTNQKAGLIDVAAKGQWITDFYNLAVTKNARMVVWFNEEQYKSRDWMVFGGASGDVTDLPTGYNTYSAYRTAVTSNNYVGSDTATRRLLTHAQFKGQ